MISEIKLIIANLLRIMLAKSIGVKPYGKTKTHLYYEKGQHLMFLLKKRILYEPVIQNKIKKYIKKSNLIFDIGGNIGQYSLLFSELVSCNGKVISLEPDQKNYAFLRFNIEINNLTNVICLKKGVSDVNNFIEFYRDTETGGRRGSFNIDFVGENYKGFKELVETTTLDALIEEFGQPEFIKIDVEGFENKVVLGLNKELNNTVFLVEVRTETKEEVFDFFNEKGYICYYIDRRKDVLISRASQIPSFANLIFAK